MGLKCSVLGHKYGDSTVERDREEQGSEVVITIQEVETCKRCGTERVVSENKEVTSIATPGDPVGPTYADDEAADDAGPSGDGAGADDAAGAADEAGAAETADASAGEETDDGTVDADGDASGPATPGEDDAETEEPAPDRGAEILDAEADEPVADDELADPSVGDEPVADEPTEDAVIMGEDDEEGDGRAPGEWPEEPGGDGDEWSPEDLVDGGDEATITAPDAGTEQNGAVTVPDGDFRCPQCDYRTAVEASSLRAGDFCPECRRGTLVHEPADGS